MNKKKQNDYYERIYQIIWNQYRLFYEEISRYDTKFQLFLAFFGIITFVYFDLELNKVPYNNYLFFGYVLAMLICLYQMIPRKMWFTLIKQDKIEKINKVEDAYKLVKDDIFGVGFHISRCITNKQISLILLINLTIITSALILINYFCFVGGKGSSILTSLIAILSLITINYFYNKEYMKNNL
ncbi:hypothetical protein HY498_01470 [Candidatus Woesearchaeota archaeon]|nr:hypothetical protein [Candidatus Woesearchaeota archaeon]